MIDWAYGKNGQATLIFDSDCFRNNRGHVIAWINDQCVYLLRGQHMGWFEEGVLYDSSNHAVGFLRNATGYLPSRPGIGGQARPAFPVVRGDPVSAASQVNRAAAAGLSMT
jgi:hypothetical protein